MPRDQSDIFNNILVEHIVALARALADVDMLKEQLAMANRKLAELEKTEAVVEDQ